MFGSACQGYSAEWLGGSLTVSEDSEISIGHSAPAPEKSGNLWPSLEKSLEYFGETWKKIDSIDHDGYHPHIRVPDVSQFCI